MPATPEALLRLMLDLEPQPQGVPNGSMVPMPLIAGVAANPWRLVGMTSLAWLAVLGMTAAGFMAALERQDRQLELLLERTTPSLKAK